MISSLKTGFLFLGAGLFTAISLPAQISGVVKDAKNGQALEAVDVFINNTSISTHSNTNGEFALTGIAPGFADLSLYKDGYQVFKNSIRIQPDKAYKLNLTLQASDGKAKSPKTRMDEEYKKNLQWFERGFFGPTANAAYCKIANPKALQFIRTGEVLTVSATEPVIVENTALGYRIYCYMQTFEAGVEEANIQGLLRLDTLTAREPAQKEGWERNRLKTYWGSERHLLKSLVDKNSREQGFELFDGQGHSLNPDSLVSPGKIQGYVSIKLPGKTRVRYLIETGTSGIQQTDKAGQISWLTPLENVEVNADGILLNARALAIDGQMSAGKLADFLPLNYVPTGSLESEKMDWQNFSLLQERIYLQTDRDYYYPKENIWFKAYLGYSMPSLRDTLSKTVYVELITPDKKIIKTKTYRIKNASAWGDFKLPDSLQAGQYYIRAYTNWMRNYGEESFYTKVVPILSLSQNLEPDQGGPAPVPSSGVKATVRANKQEFQKREEVKLDVEVKDAFGKPLNAQLSVSVTDQYASFALPEEGNILASALTPRDYAKANQYFDKIQYFMERGLSFRGQVKDEKGNPSPAKLDIVKGKLEDFITMETDEKGEFLVTGMNFQDTASFTFQATNKKGKPFPVVEILPRDVPPVDFREKPIVLKLRSDNAAQRIQNTYTPDDNVIMLEDVEVKGERISDQDLKGPAKIYGKADYTVNGDQLRSTTAGSNLLVSLQGKVPGLSVVETLDASGGRAVNVKVRGGSSSMTGDTNPLILVDGVPFPDPNSLISISPESVERIEVVTHAVTQYGSRGTNGVIAIFLKSGNYASAGAQGRPDVVIRKIAGYNKPRVFFSPDYSGGGGDSNPDFRTTIYWNPSLNTDGKGSAPISFYCADLETRYRIVVEGITDKGIPFRSESFVDVK